MKTPTRLLLPAALSCAAVLHCTPGAVSTAAAQSPAPSSPPALQTPAAPTSPAPAASPAPPSPSETAASVESARLLREALFEEQAMRDPGKAATGYEKIIASYDAERALAATALYRLAEVRRAQNRNDLAAALYRRVLTEFPDHDPLARLSRENLAALGVKDLPGAGPATGAVVQDPEDAKIEELKKLLRDSPDLATGPKPLEEAIQAGQAKVVKFLLSTGAKPDDKSLGLAAALGHLSICEALIAAGADLKAVPLDQAVLAGRTEVVRLLLSKGVDPNFSDTLTAAVAKDSVEMLDLLLAAKADPNFPSPEEPPLFPAIRKGNVTLAKRLLDGGAHPQARIGYDKARVQPRRQVRLPGRVYPGIPQNGGQQITGADGWTALHVAVQSGRVEMLDLLLGTDAVKDLETEAEQERIRPMHLAVESAQNAAAMTARLLKAGASANPSGGGSFRLFRSAVRSAESGELVKLLLGAGADDRGVDPEGNTILNYTGDTIKEAALIRQLLAAGADPLTGPQPFWKQLYGPSGSRLIQEFIYPKWSRPDTLTFCLPESAQQWTVTRKSSDEQPGSLAELLMAHFQETKVMRYAPWEPDWNTLRIFRPDASGQLKPQVMKDWTSGSPPVLQWGDIVEFVSPDWEKNPYYDPSQSVGTNEDPPAGLIANLQASIVRHVTVSLNGQSLPLTLRGGLRVYNPLKPEAPLTDAVSLMKLLGGSDPQWFRAGVKVKRQPAQGGGEISTLLQGGSVIPLKEGDALEMTGEPVKWQRNGSGLSLLGAVPGSRSSYRWNTVMLSPGLPFSITVSETSEAPGLLQFLAAAWSALPVEALEKLKSADPAGAVVAVSSSKAAAALVDERTLAVLPNPDLSKIVIRRVDEKGETLEIPVNLSIAIAACTDATTPEEARKSDVELLPGDVVTVPVLSDRRDQPWAGFDAATNRFFAKALATQVTLAEEDGSFRALSLEYLPVKFEETSAGLLGLPAAEPSPNRLSWFNVPHLLWSVAKGKNLKWLQRAGTAEKLTEAGNQTLHAAWLRPGDTLGLEVSFSNQPGVPAGSIRRQVRLPQTGNPPGAPSVVIPQPGQ